jgi:AraC-like DNA-binding protein
MSGNRDAEPCSLFHAPILPYIRESNFAVRHPWRVPERRLLDYLLIYIQEGRCTIQVNGVTYLLGPGDFCLIQPNDLVTLEGTTNTITPFAHMDFFYHPEREKIFLTLPGQVDLTPFRHLLQPRLNDYHGIFIPAKFYPIQPVFFRDTFLKMIALWKQRDLISQLEAQQAATTLILLLLKDQHLPSRDPLQEPQSLNWITSYLSFHLAEPLSVTDMAQRAYLSPSHFSTLFRARFGMSPHQYLLHLRIQHAKDLLAHTKLSLQQVASYCGFTSVYHFAKAFKKMTSCTPGSFRQASSTRLLEDEQDARTV